MAASLAITLRGMRYHTFVGVLPHEREIAQPLELDVTVWRRTVARVAPLLDYRTLHAAIDARIAAGDIGYLEDLAHDLAERVLALPDVARARIAIRKPQVPLGAPLDWAEVVLERDAS